MLLQGVQEGRKVIRWMGVLVERSHATWRLEGACTGRAATSALKALRPSVVEMTYRRIALVPVDSLEEEQMGGEDQR